MTTALTFNDVTLSPVHHQGSLWIRAAELARALGYSDERSVGKIFKRNESEFTDDMTQVIEISEGVNLTTTARIFSPRGCHLIAMFARTAVAKAFRRWVLDVLDKFAKAEHQPEALASDAPITPDQQCTLRALVKARIEAIPEAERPKGLYPQIWSRFNNHFRLARYCQLPQCRMSEAVAYLTQMELTPAKALPAAPVQPRVYIDSQTCNKQLRIAADVAQVIRQVEALKVEARRWNAPREFRRTAADTGRAEDRYEIQSDLYRACNAALSAAVAALCASAEVGEWA